MLVHVLVRALHALSEEELIRWFFLRRILLLRSEHGTTVINRSLQLFGLYSLVKRSLLLVDA